MDFLMKILRIGCTKHSLSITKLSFCRAFHAIKEGYKIPLLVVVDDLNPMELIDVMCDWGAVNVI